MIVIKYPLQSLCIKDPSEVTRKRQAEIREDRYFDFPEARGQWPIPSQLFSFDGSEALGDFTNHNMNLKWGFHISRTFNATSIVQDGLRPGQDESCVYFYSTPVLGFMKYCGDIMAKHKSYHLWLFDISQAKLEPDSRIPHSVHSHTDGLCVYTPVAVTTKDFTACRPVRVIEIPRDIINYYAHN